MLAVLDSAINQHICYAIELQSVTALTFDHWDPPKELCVNRWLGPCSGRKNDNAQRNTGGTPSAFSMSLQQ